MKRIAVIGAGISGLSVANLLKERFAVKVFEADPRPGGLIKCDRVNGGLFHTVGGHVFNSKRQDVLDYFWQFFDREAEFTKASRNAIVSMPDGRLIKYPVENHIYQMNPVEIKAIISDLTGIVRSRDDRKEPADFESFLRERFGNTLYKMYFEPYNRKVWRKDLSLVPLSWLAGKLPMPTVEEIIFNNFHQAEETGMVHSSFWYPKNDGSQFLANRLAATLDIAYNSPVKNVNYQDNKWLVNGEMFDNIIFCGNIKDLPAMTAGSIDLSGFEKPVEELDYHGTTTVFCRMEANPYSWIYMPAVGHQSHRFICTGNFAASNNPEGQTTASLEFTDYISEKDIEGELKKIPFNPEYIAHRYTRYTYPVQSHSTVGMIDALKAVTEEKGLYILGRFAEWQYYNMDAAIGAGIDLCARFIKQ